MSLIKRIIRKQIYRFPLLTKAIYSVLQSKKLNDSPTYTKQGFRFVGNKQMQEGNFEIDETKIVEQIIPKVDTVINVGANIGYYCCIALNKGKKVLAFEPMDQNLRFLLQNIKLNNWQKDIEIFPIALYNEINILKIYGAGTGASLVKGWAGWNQGNFTFVPCSTLDNILGSRVKENNILIIVDIEGAELKFLKGANSFLESQTKPIWLVEVSIKEHQPEGIIINPNLMETFELFWKAGYESYTANEELSRVDFEEISKIIENKSDTLKTHNFIFIEKGKKNKYFS